MNANRAIESANLAACESFDAYLEATRATATMHVPDCVVKAAEDAYRTAGGKGEIVVRGHGNRTHPVCIVSVAYVLRGRTYV